MTGNEHQHEALLVASQLWRQYDNHVAVRNLSLELHRGDVLGFLGPNGAGKSTTMQMLSGNLAPTAGSVMINGVDLLEEPAAAKRELGYLPEIPPLYIDMTVMEFLGFCARLHRLSRTNRGAAVDRAIERCGLGDVRHRLIGNLSKGYQQRTGIAQAVLHDPAVVILDEPTVGLDPIQIRDIRGLIRELGEAHAVILSTHLLPEVQEICNRVLMINNGQAVFEDTLDHATGSETSLRITGSTLPDDATLATLEGVHDVQRLNTGTVRLKYSRDPATLLETAVKQGWGLQEFTPERQTLEQVFIDLMSQDLPAGEDAA